jgi:hypothetical protein
MSTDAKDTAKGSAPEYEFTARQNGAISGLVTVMRVAGAAWIVFGLVSAVTLFVVHGRPATLSGQQAAAVLGLVANLAMGISTFGAASSFQRIVETKGRDITHAMAALTMLQRVFGALRIIIIVALVLGVVAFFYVAPSIGGLPLSQG